MKRRDFFLAAGAVGLAAAPLSSVSAEDAGTKREFVEVRMFTVKNEEKKRQLVDIIDKAVIPTLNAQGIEPIGVFTARATEKDYQNNVFMVVPYKTIDAFLNKNEKLYADQNLRKAAAPIFDTNSKDPVYTALETTLLYNFATMPKLVKPNLGPDRVFQLRYYRSFNIEKNHLKIDMFEHGGELPLFKKLGMNPVFFGEAVAGKFLPNLTYMVSFENDQAQDETWKTFVKHPEWDAIKNNPKYADTATEIIKVVLKPTPGSQL